MKTWKCDVCGYVHHDAGPPASCPVCGVDGDSFSILAITTGQHPPVAAGVWQCGICSYRHQAVHPPATCPVCSATSAMFAPLITPETNVEQAGNLRRIVVLGGGIAGLTAAAEARRHSPHASITLVSREPSLPYYRLNLTRFLAGDVSEEELLIQSRNWFDEQEIDFCPAEAASIDRQKHCVMLRDGRSLDYDFLVLTNGAHPFIPPFPGATREGVHVLRTIDDARAILKHIAAGMRIVCIGGGLLGLETAGALARHKAQITVIEGFPSLLPRQLPPRAGELLQKRLETQGMDILCTRTVMELVGDECVQGVVLENGQLLPADLVIITVGVRPNSYLARQAGLTVHRGIVVDDRMFTSDPHILAAGDVTEHRGALYGIWPAGYAQGAVAGCNAGGGAAEFSGMAPSTRIKVLDIDLFSCGQIHSEDASTTLHEQLDGDSYRAFFCRDGQLVGAVLYGDTSTAGLLKDIVENGRQISECPELAGLIHPSAIPV
ncbi:MAG: FAD-dependent oxidoreductase [Desulfuromonadales bacterium]